MKLLIVLISVLVSGCATPYSINFGSSAGVGRFLGSVGDGISDGAKREGESPSVVTTCTTNGYGQLNTTNCLSNGR